MKKIFTTKLFLVLLTPIIIAIGLVFFGLITFETWGINKTVGWAWDITNFNLIQFPMYILYLIIYGVLFAFKIKTQYRLSILHLILIVIPNILIVNNNLVFVTLLVSLLSCIVFFINRKNAR